MSDERLRELERRFKETGSVEDEAAWLREVVRTGGALADEITLPLLTIQLPDHERPECWIMVDLAGLFDLEFNGEAEAVLRREWTARGLAGRVSWGHEGDYVFVDAGRETIVAVAALIHEIAGLTLPSPHDREGSYGSCPCQRLQTAQATSDSFVAGRRRVCR